ncbi:MAG TPA: hypothetical protein VE777_00380 [Gaiellales bacterium]|nr:hypothetical protein [Gaiellales bacterium]
MSSNAVGAMMCLFLLILWVGMRREDRRAAQRACTHVWQMYSLYDEGRFWHRRCDKCGKDEPADEPPGLRSHR